MKKIVKFEKEDCNPCTMVSEYFETNNILFDAVNPFDDPSMAMKYKVRSVPTTLLLEGDEIVMRVIGYQPSELKLMIDRL